MIHSAPGWEVRYPKGSGACHSRCDVGAFPDEGCRPGYGCAVVERGNEPGTENFACMPARTEDIGHAT